MKALLLASTALTRNVPDQPGAAPAAPAPASPAPAPEPAAEPSPAPAAPEPAAAAAPEPAKAPGIGETLLESAKVEEPKPGEPVVEAPKPGEPAKPAEAAKPGEPEAAKPGEPAPAAETPPAYEFKFPEGIVAAPADVTALTTLFGEHKIAPEVAQKIIDTGTAALTRHAEFMASEQHRVWNETNDGWKDTVRADEELGGAGHQTAMQRCARMRDMLVQEKNRPAFNEMLRITGVGNHPEFLRLLNTAARFLDEPKPPASSGSPPPKNGQRPGGKGLRGIYEATAATKAS